MPGSGFITDSESGSRLDQIADAKVSAIRLLAIREHSCRELALKLRKRGFSDEIIAAVSAELARSDLLDDERFAGAYVRVRLQRLFGPIRIRAELRGKGVDDEVIGSALASLDEDWDQAASRWVARRGDDVSDRNNKARVYRSLVNRGFSHEQAMKALNSFINTP
jgi:regulatory protein